MYKTTRNIDGSTFMTCKDCGHAVSMNKICGEPLRSASDILKHMSTHKVSHVIAAAGQIPSELAAIRPLGGECVNA